MWEGRFKVKVLWHSHNFHSDETPPADLIDTKTLNTLLSLLQFYCSPLPVGVVLFGANELLSRATGSPPHPRPPVSDCQQAPGERRVVVNGSHWRGALWMVPHEIKRVFACFCVRWVSSDLGRVSRGLNHWLPPPSYINLHETTHAHTHASPP